MRAAELEKEILAINHSSDFESVCMKVFRFQFENVSVYQEYCRLINRTDPENSAEIPFLPIQFFKSHNVLNQHYTFEKCFKSSGTSGSIRSKHHVPFLAWYEEVFTKIYSAYFGPIKDQVILALLPNYLEQGDASLVYMVDKLIKNTADNSSGFYLNNQQELINKINALRNESKSVVLFGVSYALLDLAEKKLDFSHVKVIETGGMKGRRKELVKEELHERLIKGLNLKFIASEYGMTELMSQAYLKNDLWFEPPKWMKVRIREMNDPFSYLSDQRTGTVNVIDLANVYSCSFIATDDLGQKKDEKFKILGRFDNSDIRGCNLLLD